jgi:hypothetical protein
VARITDSRLRPREDGYCSGGYEERFFAHEYFRCAYRLQQPTTPVEPIPTDSPLAWLAELAHSLPVPEQRQLAEVLDLARQALCTLAHARFSAIAIQAIDAALAGLSITSMTA